MPRHEYDDETISRERGYGDYGRRERFGDYERRAMFGGRTERDFDRGRARPAGGWGGLMGEDIDRYRELERSRDRDRFRGEERRFGAEDNGRGIPMDETENLIASNKVEGTPVYDRFGDRLGTIHNFMVHKTRGHVVYAVLRHGGGFLGFNERYYPLEWNELTYDTRLGGYHTNLTEDDLKSFGSFDAQGRWHSRGRGGRAEREQGRERERSMMREPW
jgi:PRC-barrel domain protein